MATEVVKIVDPDNGSGTDYTSLAAWESGEQRDLVTADEIAVAKCRCTGGTADSTTVEISGWTTDNTRYCKIWCDPSDTGGDGRNGSYAHKGVWPSSGKIYRLTAQIKLSNHCIIENIASRVNIGVGGYSGCVTVLSSNFTARTVRCYFENTGTGAAITIADYITAFYLYNCILIIAGGYNHSYCSVIYSVNDGGTYCYNCTAISTGTAYSAYYSVYYLRFMHCYNCIGVLADIYSGGGVYKAESGANIYGDYTVASDSTYPSNATNYWTNVTPSFVDATNKDFHLAASDTVAKDKGYNYSSAGYNDDIDGQTRSGTWDIGADEYVNLSATWKAAENSNIYLQAGQKARIRFLIDATGNPDAKQFKLQYRRKPSGESWGDWEDVTT